MTNTATSGKPCQLVDRNDHKKWATTLLRRLCDEESTSVQQRKTMEPVSPPPPFRGGAWSSRHPFFDRLNGLTLGGFIAVEGHPNGGPQKSSGSALVGRRTHRAVRTVPRTKSRTVLIIQIYAGPLSRLTNPLEVSMNLRPRAVNLLPRQRLHSRVDGIDLKIVHRRLPFPAHAPEVAASRGGVPC